MKNGADSIKIKTLKQVSGLTWDPMNLAIGDDAQLRRGILDLWTNDAGWVLGHAMDGLLWGQIAAGQLVLACDADATWGACLKSTTLLDLRIFDRTRELRIWRADGTLQCFLVSESQIDSPSLAYDEPQIFIAGKRRDFLDANGVRFSLIEGPSGQRQAIPVDWDGTREFQRLWVRHYVSPGDESGMLRVAESRLMDIAPVNDTEE